MADGSEKVVEKAIDYKVVFCNKKGKAVLWDMMKASGYTSTNFDPNPYTTAYNEGLRMMVIRILNLTDMDEKQIEQLMKQSREADNLYGSGPSDII